MVELFANSGDSDPIPRFAASDLGLYYLSVTRLGVSSLQWVNHDKTSGHDHPSADVYFQVKVARKGLGGMGDGLTLRIKV